MINLENGYHLLKMLQREENVLLCFVFGCSVHFIILIEIIVAYKIKSGSRLHNECFHSRTFLGFPTSTVLQSYISTVSASIISTNIEKIQRLTLIFKYQS